MWQKFSQVPRLKLDFDAIVSRWFPRHAGIFFQFSTYLLNAPYALLSLASTFLRRIQPENKNDPLHSQKNFIYHIFLLVTFFIRSFADP